jgi:antitoxin ParD1/3/4
MSSIRKISIAMPEEQYAYLEAAVEAGDYATTGEVIREALRDWQEKREALLQQIELEKQAGKAQG